MLITKNELRTIIKEELVRTMIIREVRQYRKTHGRIDEGLLDLPIVKKAMSIGKGALIATALLAAAPAQAGPHADAAGFGAETAHMADNPEQMADVPERGYDPDKIPWGQKAPLASVEGLLDLQQRQRLEKFEQIDQKILDLNAEKSKASGAALEKVEKQIEHYVEMEQRLLKDVVMSHEDAEILSHKAPYVLDDYIKKTISTKAAKAFKRPGGNLYDAPRKAGKESGSTKPRKGYKVKGPKKPDLV